MTSPRSGQNPNQNSAPDTASLQQSVTDFTTQFTNQWSRQFETTGQTFWQGQTAFWETVGSIMQQRTTLFAGLAQATPAWQQKFLTCTTFPQFVETYSQWLADTTSRTATLTNDVLAQRAWLWQQWQQLAQRNSGSHGTFSAPATLSQGSFNPFFSFSPFSSVKADQAGTTASAGHAFSGFLAAFTQSLAAFTAPSSQTQTRAGNTSSHTATSPLQATVQQSAGLGVTTPRTAPTPIYVPELTRQKATTDTTDAITTLMNQDATATAVTATVSTTDSSVSRTAGQSAVTSHSASARRSVIASRRTSASRRYAR